MARTGYEALFFNSAAAAEFGGALPTRHFGRRLEYHAEAGSTNDLAARAARAGAPHGTIIVADHQSAGRGRRGRAWLAPPGAALLFSAVIRTEGLPPERLGWLALAAGLAAGEAVARRTRVRVRVKWPNDLVVAGAPRARGPAPWRKLGGILCESVVSHGAGFAVLGIGINVRQRATELPAEAKAVPTSLYLESGRDFARPALLAAILEALEARVQTLYGQASFPSLQALLREQMAGWWAGWHIQARGPEGERAGRFAGLDDFGRLLLSDAAGVTTAWADAEIVGLTPAPGATENGTHKSNQ